MKVEVRVYKSKQEGNVKAYANLTLEGEFAVNGFRVVEGKKGLFVSPPSYLNKTTNSYVEIAFPVTSEFREKLYSEIISAYENWNPKEDE